MLYCAIFPRAKIGALTERNLVEPSDKKIAFLFFIASSSAPEKPPSGPVIIDNG